MLVWLGTVCEACSELLARKRRIDAQRQDPEKQVSKVHHDGLHGRDVQCSVIDDLLGALQQGEHGCPMSAGRSAGMAEDELCTDCLLACASYLMRLVASVEFAPASESVF